MITGNVINFGTVSPGTADDVGTLTIKGSYRQESKGTLVIRIGGTSAGQHDVLVVNGKAELGGTLSFVRASKAPSFKLGDKIIFLTADGGVEGKFKEVSNPFNSNSIIKTKVVYGSNTVSLEAEQGSYAEFADLQHFTPNQRATARVVDAAAFGGKNKEMVAYLNARPLKDLPADLDRIAPEEVAAVYRLGVGLAGVQNQNLQRRMDDLRLSNRRVNTTGFQTNGTGPSYSGQLGAGGTTGPQGQTGAIVRPADQRWGAFLNGMGEWIRIGNTENARGYELSTGGVTVGVDYRATDNFAVGVSAGYAGTGADLAGGGKLRVNSGKIGAYATYYDGGFYADAAVSAGYNNYETQRAGLQGTARGKTDGAEVNAMLGAGYDWSLEALTLGALTSVEYTYLGIDDYTETGSLAPLTISRQHGQSLRSKLGFKAVYDWRLGGVLVRPEVRAVWQHEFGDRSFDIDSRLASGAGDVFTVNDPAVGRDSLLLGIGGSVLWNSRAATYLFYDGELYRKESESHNISGGVRVSF
jgi:outer membrane autotransporter protein